LEDGATEKEEPPVDDTMEDADDLVCTKKKIMYLFTSVFST